MSDTTTTEGRAPSLLEAAAALLDAEGRCDDAYARMLGNVPGEAGEDTETALIEGFEALRAAVAAERARRAEQERALAEGRAVRVRVAIGFLPQNGRSLRERVWISASGNGRDDGPTPGAAADFTAVVPIPQPVEIEGEVEPRGEA